MPTVYFDRENKYAEVSPGATILQAARAAGITIDSPCGGAGTCGKCTVLADGVRVLACHTEVTRDISVHTIPREQNATLRILHDGVSLETGLFPALTKAYDAALDRTEVLFEGQIAGFEQGDTSKLIFGASVDIGTTTLVAALVDLTTGKTVSEDSALNPQSLFAQDVLSRISYASEEGGLKTLFGKVTEAINTLLRSAAEKAGIKTDYIYEAVYSGNTCMLHLATDVPPDSLGAYPYTPVVTGGGCVPSHPLGIAISPFGRIVLPSVLSAYVGADITSGILAVGLQEKKGTTLFVDIGTNGEMVIARDGRLVATSTAAGPAFEGMNIACGMRASSGAVESFEIAEDDTVRVGTIGGAPAKGICGSGLLDIAGELVAHGVITSSGRFVKDRSGLPEALGARLIEKEGRTVFSVENGVFLSQKDVRQIQLAKGAIRAGIESLLQSVEVKAEQVDEVLIAGSFGYHLRAKNLIAIGLLPKEFDGRVSFVGNTSKTGGEALLRDFRLRDKLTGIVSRAQVVELANHEDFQSLFVKCLNF